MGGIAEAVFPHDTKEETPAAADWEPPEAPPQAQLSLHRQTPRRMLQRIQGAGEARGQKRRQETILTSQVYPYDCQTLWGAEPLPQRQHRSREEAGGGCHQEPVDLNQEAVDIGGSTHQREDRRGNK